MLLGGITRLVLHIIIFCNILLWNAIYCDLESHFSFIIFLSQSTITNIQSWPFSFLSGPREHMDVALIMTTWFHSRASFVKACMGVPTDLYVRVIDQVNIRSITMILSIPMATLNYNNNNSMLFSCELL